MEEKEITYNNPHDRYFKAVFSDKHNVEGLLQGALPEIYNNIDLQTLQIDNNSYIKKELQTEFSDIVYSCKYGEKKIKIALLFEHKSTEDINVEMQMLHYIISIWEHNFKQKERYIPVIPIIFHHGENKLQLNAFEHFKEFPEELKKYIPFFECELIDLSCLEAEQIVNLYKIAGVSFSMIVFKYARNNPEKIFEVFERFNNIFESLSASKQGKDLIFTSTIYIAMSSVLDKDKIVSGFEKLSREAGDIAKSTWEIEREKALLEGRLEGIEEGIEKGIEKGRVEGIEKVAIELIKKKFSDNTISDVTGLSEKQVSKIRKNLKL